MSPIKVAVLSGVRHALDYVGVLSADPRVEIIGIAEEAGAPEWARADSQQVAAEVGVPFVASVDLLLAQRPTLSVVCSEPTRHARLASQAMRSGSHVLVDKPAATTFADADALVATANQAGRTCAVMNRTHAGALRRLRAWVEAGHIGLPRHLDLEFLASGAHFSTSVERPELVVDPALSGGGEMLNFLGYCTDAVHYLTGLSTREVHAFAGTLFSPAHAATGVEDTAVLTLVLERGVTATVTLGRVPYALHGTPTSSSIRLLGSHGHAVADDEQPAVAQFSAAGAQALIADTAQAAVAAYLDEVIAAVLAGRQPDYTITEARNTLAVIDAAYRSSEQGEVVTVRG